MAEDKYSIISIVGVPIVRYSASDVVSFLCCVPNFFTVSVSMCTRIFHAMICSLLAVFFMYPFVLLLDICMHFYVPSQRIFKAKEICFLYRNQCRPFFFFFGNSRQHWSVARGSEKNSHTHSYAQR